jgi:hypothetical protein
MACSDMDSHLGNAFVDGLTSPKFPNVALRSRARILAFAFWSAKANSQASKSDDRTNVFTTFSLYPSGYVSASPRFHSDANQELPCSGSH